VAARDSRRHLLGALFLMALAALMMHLRIHPFLAPDKTDPGVTHFRASFVAAALLPLLDVVLVTLLFSSRRTAVYGYLLNGLIVIYGTILMAHFSIASLAPKALPPIDWIMNSTLPDIALAWADFFVGAALYRSWMRETDESPSA
jgi:hypothetical protein